MFFPIISQDLWFNFAGQCKGCLKGFRCPKMISSTWIPICVSKGTWILSRHFHLILLFFLDTAHQKHIERNKFFFFLQQALQSSTLAVCLLPKQKKQKPPDNSTFAGEHDWGRNLQDLQGCGWMFLWIPRARWRWPSHLWSIRRWPSDVWWSTTGENPPF